jgi:hypothetical protein
MWVSIGLLYPPKYDIDPVIRTIARGIMKRCELKESVCAEGTKVSRIKKATTKVITIENRSIK